MPPATVPHSTHLRMEDIVMYFIPVYIMMGFQLGFMFWVSILYMKHTASFTNIVSQTLLCVSSWLESK